MKPASTSPNRSLSPLPSTAVAIRAPFTYVPLVLPRSLIVHEPPFGSSAQCVPDTLPCMIGRSFAAALRPIRMPFSGIRTTLDWSPIRRTSFADILATPFLLDNAGIIAKQAWQDNQFHGGAAPPGASICQHRHAIDPRSLSSANCSIQRSAMPMSSTSFAQGRCCVFYKSVETRGHNPPVIDFRSAGTTEELCDAVQHAGILACNRLLAGKIRPC